jgi:glucose-1-phosphate adenylyltransferase
LQESVIMDRVDIGRGTKIRRAILDKDVRVAPGAEIGFDLGKDRKRFHVSEGGIVVIPKGTVVE